MIIEGKERGRSTPNEVRQLSDFYMERGYRRWKEGDQVGSHRDWLRTVRLNAIWFKMTEISTSRGVAGIRERVPVV